MLMKTQHCSSSSLQQRVESLQRHIDILRSARKDAALSASELRRANEKITAQLNSLTEKLCSNKQLTQVTWGKKQGNEKRGGVGCKYWEVSYFSVFVFLFVVLLYLLGAESAAVAGPLPLSCLISVADRPTLACGGQHHGAEEGMRISLSLCFSLSDSAVVSSL